MMAIGVTYLTVLRAGGGQETKVRTKGIKKCKERDE